MKSIYINKVLNITKFLEEEKIIQTKIIYSILEETYQDNLMLISYKHVELILDLIKSDKANALIQLLNSIQAIKSYATLVMARLTTKPDESIIELDRFFNLLNGTNI